MSDSAKRKGRADPSRRRARDRVDLGEPYLGGRNESTHESTEEERRGAITVRLPTGWQYLRSWLQRYAAAHPMAGVADLVFRSRQRAAFATGIEYEAAMEGAYGGAPGVPVFEFIIVAGRGTCTLTSWCNEPRMNSDFRALLMAIADQWDDADEAIAEFVTRAQASETPELDPDVAGGRYGTNRDLTFDDVCAIVKRCRAFVEHGGKVPDFYRRQNLEALPGRYYSLETLRSWLKDPKFKR